jgi:hypothetical protein
MVLTLGGGDHPLQPRGYSDADWGGDLDDRKSRTGSVVFLGNGPVIWTSKLQQSQSLSSTEAEYISLSHTCQDVIWLRTLLQEMQFPQLFPSIIYEDNKSTIKIAGSYKQHPGIRHIDIRHNFVRDRILSIGDITLEYLSTGDMIADMFTKALPASAFGKHRHALGLSLPVEGRC